MEELRFKLDRKAKGRGGDRYSCAAPIQGEDKPWIIYIPQAVSRSGGEEEEPHEEITITVRAP